MKEIEDLDCLTDVEHHGPLRGFQSFSFLIELSENTNSEKSMHGVNNRQLEIIKILKCCKFVTTAELQEKLNVTRRTLRYDFAYLKKVYPNNIITHRGNGGGIEWKE